MNKTKSKRINKRRTNKKFSKKRGGVRPRKRSRSMSSISSVSSLSDIDDSPINNNHLFENLNRYTQQHISPYGVRPLTPQQRDFILAIQRNNPRAAPLTEQQLQERRIRSMQRPRDDSLVSYSSQRTPVDQPIITSIPQRPIRAVNPQPLSNANIHPVPFPSLTIAPQSPLGPSDLYRGGGGFKRKTNKRIKKTKKYNKSSKSRK